MKKNFYLSKTSTIQLYGRITATTSLDTQSTRDANITVTNTYYRSLGSITNILQILEIYCALFGLMRWWQTCGTHITGDTHVIVDDTLELQTALKLRERALILNGLWSFQNVSENKACFLALFGSCKMTQEHFLKFPHIMLIWSKVASDKHFKKYLQLLKLLISFSLII